MSKTKDFPINTTHMTTGLIMILEPSHLTVLSPSYRQDTSVFALQ